MTILCNAEDMAFSGIVFYDNYDRTTMLERLTLNYPRIYDPDSSIFKRVLRLIKNWEPAQWWHTLTSTIIPRLQTFECLGSTIMPASTIIPCLWSFEPLTFPLMWGSTIINQHFTIMDRFYLGSTIIPLYVAAVCICHDELLFAVLAIICAGVLLWKAGVCEPE